MNKCSETHYIKQYSKINIYEINKIIILTTYYKSIKLRRMYILLIENKMLIYPMHKIPIELI